MRLDDDEEQGDMGPAKVGELELEMPGLEGADKEDEPWERQLATSAKESERVGEGVTAPQM